MMSLTSRNTAFRLLALFVKGASSYLKSHLDDCQAVFPSRASGKGDIHRTGLSLTERHIDVGVGMNASVHRLMVDLSGQVFDEL